MEIYRTHRPGKDRIFKRFAEQLQAGICRLIGTQGVHLDADFLPLVIVANRRVSDTLRSRSGNLIFTCPAVAYGTDLAVFPDTESCIF